MDNILLCFQTAINNKQTVDTDFHCNRKEEIQYPVAAPLSSITFGITFLRCLMYLKHLSTVTVSQNCLIPSTSSSWHCGLASLRIHSLSSCHKFSIGLRSGDSAGVRHQVMPLSARKFWAATDVCFGSLSAINRWPLGYTSATNGISVFCRISMYRNLSIVPVKMHIPVGRFKLSPAQTWTL